VNSSYNALAAQIDHKFTCDLQFNANYTWAKALDYNQYIGTGSPANNLVDPLNPNLRTEYGRSRMMSGTALWRTWSGRQSSAD
jgi:hypothetical protein